MHLSSSPRTLSGCRPVHKTVLLLTIFLSCVFLSTFQEASYSACAPWGDCITITGELEGDGGRKDSHGDSKNIDEGSRASAEINLSGDNWLEHPETIPTYLTPIVWPILVGLTAVGMPFCLMLSLIDQSARDCVVNIVKDYWWGASPPVRLVLDVADAYKEAKTKDIIRARDLFNKAKEYKNNSQWNEAEAALLQSLDYSRNPVTYLYLGYVSANKCPSIRPPGCLDKAIRMYKKALEMAPENDVLRFYLSWAAIANASAEPKVCGKNKCNYFVAHVAKSRDIPYFRDILYPGRGKDDIGGNDESRYANELWKFTYKAVRSRNSGLQAINMDEAQKLANRGYFVFGVAKHQDFSLDVDSAKFEWDRKHGHVVLVAPDRVANRSLDPGTGPWIRSSSSSSQSIRAISPDNKPFYSSHINEVIWAYWEGKDR